MKRISLISVMLVVFVVTVSADEWINFNERGESAPLYDVINSTNSLVEFELEIPGMESEEIDNFNRVYIPEHTKMDSVGFPEVPVVSYLIAIPECDNVNLNVTLLDSIVIDNINIYPAPEWIEQNNGDYTYLEEQFTINNTFYNTDEYFPGNSGELVGKGAVRTQHCIRVKIYPVQFNPVQQQVIAYSRLNIEMTFDNAVGSVNNDAGIFNEVCGGAMMNYNSNGLSASVSCGSSREGSWDWVDIIEGDLIGDYINPVCDYLIVTHEDFYTDLEAREQIELLAQKRATYNGFDVMIVKMDDIENEIYSLNDLNSERIRNLIQNTYDINGVGNAQNTFDGRLGYVLLFGDAYFGEDEDDECVPTYWEDEEEGEGGFDIYFSQLTELNGTYDVYPDIYLGRIPVDFELNTGVGLYKVENVCQKLIDFEPVNINSPNYNGWKERMAFVNGDYESTANQGYEIILPLIEEYDTTLLSYAQNPNPPAGFNHIDESYNGSFDNMNNVYEAGNVIIYFAGHGTGSEYTQGWNLNHDIAGTGWSYAQINSGQYDYRLPFLISMSCATGNFHANNSGMAEVFLGYNEIRGCIGLIAASTNSESSAFHDFAPYCYIAFSQSLTTCGEMLLEAKLKTIVPYFRKQYNLFGDPALNIILDSVEIELCDLQCGAQQINIEVINNQILQITAGVSNLSSVDITGDIVVECQLMNSLTGNSQTATSTIDGLTNMETKGANFSFNISDCMPTEFDILITVDPVSLITERNEENNEAEKEYSYYKYQENFPVIVNVTEWIFITGDKPLYHNDNIILGGKKISSSGELLLDCNLRTEGLSLPIKVNENDYDYIVRELLVSGQRFHRINGNTGNIEVTYSIDLTEHRFYNYCLGDLNNDGIEELICYYSTTPHTQRHLAIFDLDGNLLTPDPIPINNIRDIAIGDSNNDGKNELYILTSNSLTSYDYNNGVLTQINQINLIYASGNNLALADFNDDGYLDCVTFLNSNVQIYNCCDFIPLITDPINLTSDYNNFAIGDIDNDGVTEIVVTQDGVGSCDTDIYKIDILETEYELLFSENDIANNYSRLSLYDLNSDNELDIIFGDRQNLNGYLISGDLLFSLPNNQKKTYSIVTDLDSDGDIEVIFGEEAPDFGQFTNYKISASDLNIPVGNYGNIYPKMNEFNNNLYSQPVTGLLSENTDYYWFGSITLHGDIILPSTSTLTIHPSTIIKAKENSKLTINGDLHAEGFENQPITFIPVIYEASENYWQGIEITNFCNASLEYCEFKNAESIYFNNCVTENTISNVIFDNCNLISEKTYININEGQFSNAQIRHNGYDLVIHNTRFENSSIYAKTTGTEEPTEIVSINNCTFQDQDALTNIFISGYPNYEIIDNEIFSNGNNCIYLYESGMGKIHDIKDNDIVSNNNSCGIFIYHSYVDIVGCNNVSNNLNGITGSHKSNIYMKGYLNEEFQHVHNNLEDEVVFTHDSFPVGFIFNIVEDDDGNHTYKYVRCIDHPSTSLHNIELNYWGEDFSPHNDLEPPDGYDFEPIWEPGGRDGEIGEDEELYLSAKQYFVNEEYESAEQTFKDIISLYPESEFAKASAKELLALEQYLNNDYLELQNYYENETNMYYDEEMTDLADYLINYCNIKLGEYPAAIEWFESIIMDPPSEPDSIFAIIDAGYTYLLMEEEDRYDYVGKMPKLKPTSQKAFEDKRDRLLADLFGFPYFDDDIADDIIPESITLEHNYPNPFNPNTTISFSIPEDSKVNLSIYNIKGQKVNTLTDSKFERGLHKLIWDSKDSNGKSVSSGIYFYKLKVNGKSEAVKKCLLLK